MTSLDPPTWVHPYKTPNYTRNTYQRSFETRCHCWHTFGTYKEFVVGTTTNSSGSTTYELETKLYLGGKYAPPKTNSITWWRENTPEFPSLSRMARDYLSVLTEEDFSTAGDIMSKRNRLVGENI